MLHALAIRNYRSVRDLVLPLEGLNVVTGPNGSGKSNLYRALRLLAAAARGRLVPSLAREGGLPSVFWAGPETIARSVRQGQHKVEGLVRKEAMRLLLGFASDDFGYAVDLGYPIPSATAFGLDPEIKRECIWSGPTLRPSTLLVDRRGPALCTTAKSGSLEVVSSTMRSFESMLTAYADPRGAPEVIAVREQIRSWRFYDHFRTDPDAPARMPQIGTHTPVLGDDGSDLAAALQTIREIGDPEALAGAVDDAFPGSTIAIETRGGRFETTMRQHGILRPLAAAELSDGTLRYLMVVAALLTPRPPELMVLNEPETSLHPDLIPALARLVGLCAERSQVIVVTHNAALAQALETEHRANMIVLEKSFGETRPVDPGRDVRWEWPKR